MSRVCPAAPGGSLWCPRGLRGFSCPSSPSSASSSTNNGPGGKRIDSRTKILGVPVPSCLSFPLFILQGRKGKKKNYDELLIRRHTHTHKHNVGTAAHPTPTHHPAAAAASIGAVSFEMGSCEAEAWTTHTAESTFSSHSVCVYVSMHMLYVASKGRRLLLFLERHTHARTHAVQPHLETKTGVSPCREFRTEDQKGGA